MSDDFGNSMDLLLEELEKQIVYLKSYIQVRDEGYFKLVEWVKEQTHFAHPRMIDEVHSIGIEAKELLREIGEDV